VPQGSALSPTFYKVYINDTPRNEVFIWPSLPMSLVLMLWIAKRAMFSESCKAVWIQLGRDARIGTLKSIKIKLGRFASLRDVGHMRFV
jgi:hypothetical protein